MGEYIINPLSCGNRQINPFLSEHIYHAARDGLSLSLYQLLGSVNEATRNAIINQKFVEPDGQIFTPLIVAAKNGRYKVVQILLENFLPNLEQEGTVKFSGHNIQGATALWCSAGAGHLNVLKILIQYGADVNHKTKTQSTPLRAACFDGRLDIVKYLIAHKAEIDIANTYNNTCLMISAYKGHTDIVELLLSHGADTNNQANCGATALHYAAENGHLEICEKLLNYGAQLKENEYGMTPVITAAERTRESIVELFHSRSRLLTRQQKIDSIELMGASFANDKDNYSLTKAYRYLMKAMKLRYENRKKIIRKNMIPPVPAYENWIECGTIQDLQAIELNDNSIHMESLTIRERILTKKCPDVAHPVVYRGAVCADNGRFDRCESLWLHALELRQHNMLSIQRDLLRFAQVFSQMYELDHTMRMPNVIAVLKSCICELELNKSKMNCPGPKDDIDVIEEEYELNFITALYLCTIIAKLIKDKNRLQIQDVDINESYKLVVILCRSNLRLRDGQTFLHLAVNGVTPVDDFHTNDVCRFPCLDTVKLLLYCGADICEQDFEQNTPLHTLATTLQLNFISTEENRIALASVILLFVEAGIHVDAVNSDGLTASKVCASRIVSEMIRHYEVKHTSLKCLAARNIAQHKIDYKNVLPKQLETFVKLHSSDKI